MKHLISVDDIDSLGFDFLGMLFRRASDLRRYRNARRGSEGLGTGWPPKTMSGRLMISDFFEPSTRTRLSFEAAMSYLDGYVIGTENAAEFSSVKKGESIGDNFKVISGYADVIVGRFRNEGEARIAADASLIPVINGGDGKGEHPTQALIDLFIIDDYLKLMSKNELLTVTFIGDNDHSRTVHSLAKLISRYNVHINYATKLSLEDDKTPFWEVRQGRQNINGHVPNITHLRSLDTVLANSHVVYLTRLQKERHSADTQTLPFVFTSAMANLMPENSLILHPLPRNEELPPEIDTNPRAKYFEQAHNGLYVRMALLETLLRTAWVTSPSRCY